MTATSTAPAEPEADPDAPWFRIRDMDLSPFPQWAGRLAFLNTLDPVGRVIDHRDGDPIPTLGAGPPIPMDYLGAGELPPGPFGPFSGLVTRVWADRNTLWGEGVAEGPMAAALAAHDALNVGVFLADPTWQLRHSRRGRPIAAITTWRLAAVTVYAPGNRGAFRSATIHQTNPDVKELTR